MHTIYEIQQKYGIAERITDMDKATYLYYHNSARNMLNNSLPSEFYNWDLAKQTQYKENLLIKYVNDNPMEVEGFMSESGELLISELVQRLRKDLIEYGILQDALDDPEIQEIQINDFKTIYVVKHGKATLYCDKKGKPYQFLNNEELHTMLDKLTYNSKESTNGDRFTVTDPILNTRTVDKGYRVSAVHYSATTRDMTPGFDFPVTNVTIRKYSPVALGFEDLVKFRSLTPKMARLLSTLGATDNVNFFCVGATSSGKTTLLNAVFNEIDDELRGIAIQNPTECMKYKRNPETGANMANVLHWEAQALSGEDARNPRKNSMSNLIATALRNTPDYLLIGEIRVPEEASQTQRAGTTGHRVLSTLHTEYAKGFIERMSQELATLGGSREDHVRSIAELADIVVTQHKYKDGNRRIIAIEEVLGWDEKENVPITNLIFEYKMSGKTDKDEYGKPKLIHGYFQQKNPISEVLLNKLYASGFDKSEVEEFTVSDKTIYNVTDDFNAIDPKGCKVGGSATGFTPLSKEELTEVISSLNTTDDAREIDTENGINYYQPQPVSTDSEDTTDDEDFDSVFEDLADVDSESVNLDDLGLDISYFEGGEDNV